MMTKYIQINICLYNITECISFYLYTLKCVIHVHNFWNWTNVWPIQLSYIVGTCTHCFSRSSSFFSTSPSVYHYLLLFPRTILFMLWCHHVVFIYSACCPTRTMYALDCIPEYVQWFSSKSGYLSTRRVCRKQILLLYMIKIPELQIYELLMTISFMYRVYR